jgi:hypothetical protein
VLLFVCGRKLLLLRHHVKPITTAAASAATTRYCNKVSTSAACLAFQVGSNGTRTSRGLLRRRLLPLLAATSTVP